MTVIAEMEFAFSCGAGFLLQEPLFFEFVGTVGACDLEKMQ